MIMRALHRKLLRDVWATRGQVITIALVLAGSIAALTGIMGTYRALYEARAAYYTETGFPDVFAHVGRAPEQVADQLRALPGIASVTTRLVEPATIALPGTTELPTATVLSLPGGARPTLTGLRLRRGRAPDPDRPEECVVLDAFATAHQLEPGATLAVIIRGRQHQLRLVGTVLSPEFLFSMAEGGMMPDDLRFTAVYLSRPAVAGAVGATGTFDDVTVRLSPGASERAAVADLDRVLARYGGRGARARAQQPSHKFVTDELGQLQGMATRVPTIFLLVAAFLINVVLSRLVATQREQIAALRALGYSPGAIARHYLGYAVLIAVIGGAIGLLGGYGIGRAFCTEYGRYFRFPTIEFHLGFDLLALGVATGALTVAFGALRAVRAASRLPPAEAMRPPTPPRYRRGVLSHLGFLRLASPTGRLVVRELERRPQRAAISVLGLALAMALIVVGNFSRDTMDYLVDVQFRRALGADVTVGLVELAPLDVLGEFRQLPGVLAVEPTRSVPVRIHVGHRMRELAITATVPGTSLREVLDRDGRVVAIPREGLLLGAMVAERLGVKVGDRVTLEILEHEPRTRVVVVTALADEMMGLTAYMDLRALAALLREEPKVSGVMIAVDPDRLLALHRRLSTLPGIAGVAESRTIRDAFEKTTGGFTAVMTLVVVLFGTVIAVGVVYNHGRVVVAERARELATLRVLGFTTEEVSAAVIGELAVHVTLALPLGVVIGRWLAQAIMSSVDPEMYRMPVIIAPSTFGMAALVVIAAAALTAVTMARRVARLDPVSALKAHD